MQPGPRRYLNYAEKELGDFLKRCVEVGYGKTRRDVMGIAEAVAVEKGVLRRSQISEGWWRRFLERQPTLTLQCEPTAHSRTNAVDMRDHEPVFLTPARRFGGIWIDG